MLSHLVVAMRRVVVGEAGGVSWVCGLVYGGYAQQAAQSFCLSPVMLVAPTAYVLHTRTACARSLIETVGSQLLDI